MIEDAACNTAGRHVRGKLAVVKKLVVIEIGVISRSRIVACAGFHLSEPPTMRPRDPS